MVSDASDPRDPRFDEVRRCLAEADRAFARAGAVTDEDERTRLIEEAEAWLIRAERRLTRLVDKPMSLAHPDVVSGEHRSFSDTRKSSRSLVWRRQPKA
ncbi:hypothetical protein [Phenylobacterium soli]|uniref:Uncharacterized protein n=1 Tax=Phenylobacterium soli TaxID=2170551 RepID=A0A328AJC7_9CAUL|nr:hypothetical protein [Phenylobacterium soli]RAK54535.1 hypothetical protein DJ017_08375 [Phenylobacterium soli]